MAPATERQTEVEQPVLKHHTSHGDGCALEQREIGDAHHPGAVLLQEHHLLRRAVQRPPLLNTPLQGAFAAIPLLAREALLEMEQQGLRFKLRRLLKHRHQHALPYGGEWISSGAPIPAALRLILGLMVSSIDALGATHRNTGSISGDLLAEALGPFGHVPLLDPQRQRGGHDNAPDRNRSPVVAS